MTGPQHLEAADTAFAGASAHKPGSPEYAALIACAQAHATAALTLAVARRDTESADLWKSYLGG